MLQKTENSIIVVLQTVPSASHKHHLHHLYNNLVRQVKTIISNAGGEAAVCLKPPNEVTAGARWETVAFMTCRFLEQLSRERERCIRVRTGEGGKGAQGKRYCPLC